MNKVNQYIKSEGFANVNKIDITVLVTSITQREVTLETAIYYSKICNEVIIVDEEKPHLSVNDVDKLHKRGIRYFSYNDGSDESLSSTYEKRLIAATHAKSNYVVHSNHDERYTYQGLLASLNELKNKKDLIFCVGQCIAVRKDESGIFFTRSYPNLDGYKNVGNLEQRLYYHSKKYAPLAHYAVWRRESYIHASEKTVTIHNLTPSTTMMEEVIFELAADLTGNSKAIPELFWIRNRINPHIHNSNDTGTHIFKIIEEKLKILFAGADNVKIDIFIKNFCNNSFAFLQTNLLLKTLILVRKKINNMGKKKKITDIDYLLNSHKINYNSDDISNIFRSSRFFM